MWKTIGSLKKFAFRYGANGNINIASLIGGFSWKERENVNSSLTEINTLSGETDIVVTSSKVAMDTYEIKSKISNLSSSGSSAINIPITSGVSSSIQFTNTIYVNFTFTYSFKIYGLSTGMILFDIYDSSRKIKEVNISVQGTSLETTITGAKISTMCELYNQSNTTITFRNLRTQGDLSVISMVATSYYRMYADGSNSKNLKSITLITEGVINE